MPRSRPRSSPVRSPDSQRQHAVGPELVVDVLVAQQKAEQPLRNQLPHRMLDPPLAPVVAASRGVRSSSASAWRDNGAPLSVLSRPPSPTALGLKLKLQRFTVCGVLLRGRCSDLTTYTANRRPHAILSGEISGLRWPPLAEGASRQHRCQRANRRDPPRPAWHRHCLDYSVSPEEPAPAYSVTTMVVGIPTACPNAKRFPVLQKVVKEQTPHLFPEVAGTLGFHLRLPACNIAVEQERQHQREDGRQVFLAVVVLKAVALVLQGKFRSFQRARPVRINCLSLLIGRSVTQRCFLPFGCFSQ